MIITPHLLIGAAIGFKVKHFGWIIFLGIISHFFLDIIPHWDYENKEFKVFSKNKSYKSLLGFFLKIVIDSLIGLIILFFVIWQKNITNSKYLLYILIGILASLLPDIISVFNKLIPNKLHILKVYETFHEEIFHNPQHIKKPTFIGLGTEILTSIIAILIMLL